jgi:hypothetical protein
MFYFLTHCLSHLLFLVRLLVVWFAQKSAVMMLIVPVRVQKSRCMGLGSVSWDLSIPSGVRLVVVLLVVVWPVVSDMPIYGGFLYLYVFCMLHVLYIYLDKAKFTRCREARVYVFQYWGWVIVLHFEKNIYPCREGKENFKEHEAEWSPVP